MPRTPAPERPWPVSVNPRPKMARFLRLIFGACLACLSSASLAAKEGMFTPDQIEDIRRDLRRAGLRMDPDLLADLTGFPMGAIVSLGNCSASFVSSTGLVVTNHHCARGSIQFNSTETKNYLETGFLAPTIKDELPAAPGSRIYVTRNTRDVTREVLRGVDAIIDEKGKADTSANKDDEAARYKAVYDQIETNRKALIAACEKTPGHRCQVSSFYGGLIYKLIERLEIKDVRLVYAPSDHIGKYGGDIDNWRWPRHTGDFTFYRAYVAPDGTSATYAETNVPYKPTHYLKVSAAGVRDGDFILGVGYPGSTQRYSRLSAVKNSFSWTYPTYIKLLEGWIETIEKASPAGSDARIKYESRLAGLNNALKNFRGQIDGAARVNLLQKRKMRESALRQWLGGDTELQEMARIVKKTDVLSEERASAARRAFWFNNATRPQLLGAAQNLYRLAKERQKPDAQRESGFQERDMDFLRQRLNLIERRYDPEVDQAEWLFFLEKYMAAPSAEHVAAFDAALSLHGQTKDDLAKRIAGFYEKTTLKDAQKRLALMQATPVELEAMDDPFMKLAIALYSTEIALENESKALAGKSTTITPSYMLAIIAWERRLGKTTYPDANSTLRLTYGKVFGGSPEDGLIYAPFTTLEGVVAKNRGKAPFAAPQKLLDAVAARDYGRYASSRLSSVPVNYLSDLDITGGNSGSATLNKRGELVGLLFDGTLESVNSDWYFDSRSVRAIHVDSRYMLWVMEKVDAADRLLKEMDIVYKR